MSRPAPRKTSLTGASPVAPPVREARPATSSPSRPTATAPTVAPSAPAGEPAKRRYPPKVSFYQDPADSARMRAAMLHTQGIEGHRSLSDFISRAVMEEVERLEAKYNAGQPWPAVNPGDGPTGRPVG